MPTWLLPQMGPTRFLAFPKVNLQKNVDPVHAVKLSHDQLLDIKSLVDKLRPSKRHSKYVFYPAALLMTDHCLLSIISESPTLSIEIKHVTNALYFSASKM